MTDRLTTEELLTKISRQLDYILITMLDMRRDALGDLAPMPDPDSLPVVEDKPPTPLGEPRIMVNGDLTHIRQPLPGRNYLVAVMNNKTGNVAGLQIEDPSGDRHDVTAEEIKDAFGIELIKPHPEQPASHPTDRSLNPDVEVADDRS